MYWLLNVWCGRWKWRWYLYFPKTLNLCCDDVLSSPFLRSAIFSITNFNHFYVPFNNNGCKHRPSIHQHNILSGIFYANLIFFELNECQDFFPIHLFLAYKTRTHVRTGSVVFGSIRPSFALIKFEKGKYAVRISHFGTAHGLNEAQTHRFSPPFWENFGYFIIRRKFIISMYWCPCRQPVPL